MGLLGWSPTPAKNGVADLTIPAIDSASGRSLPGLVRSVMAAVRRYADAQGGALKTGGTLNAYTVDTGLGIAEIRPGIDLIVQADRTNTAEATLNVDGLGPLPWVDAGGVRLLSGRIISGRFYHVILDAAAETWRVQAGASTLSEIPGLVEGIADVSAKAAQVAADRTAVSAAALQTAADRADVAEKAAQVDEQYQQVASAVGQIGGFDVRLTAEIVRATVAEAGLRQDAQAGDEAVLADATDLIAAARAALTRGYSDLIADRIAAVLAALQAGDDAVLADALDLIGVVRTGAATALAQREALLMASTASVTEEMLAAQRLLPRGPARYFYNTSLGYACARKTLYVFWIWGQSLALGSTKGPVISTVPVYPGRALMPDTGLHAGGGVPSGAVDLVESVFNGAIYETLASGFANHLLRDLDARLPGNDAKVACYIAAQGATDYRQIKRGSPVYAAGLNQLEGLTRIAERMGYRVEAHMLCDHGENAVFVDGERYDQFLGDHSRCWIADARAITGQDRDAMLFVIQTDRVLNAAASKGQVLQRSQIEAARTNPNICLIGGGYECSRNPADHVHDDSPGAYDRGVIFARAVFDGLFGQGFRAIEPTDARFVIRPDGSGRILLPMHVPVEPLRIDTSGAVIGLTGPAAAPGYGFEVFDPAGNPLAIGAVTVLQGSTDPTDCSPPTLAIDLAALPSTPQILVTYAGRRNSPDDANTDDGPVTGARGAICDSAPYLNQRTGQAMPNRMLHWHAWVATPAAASGGTF